MLRILMAALLTAAPSACTIGLPSSIDAAPFDLRMPTAPFSDGTYCTLTQDEADRLLVPGQMGDSQESCRDFTWDTARRLFVMQGGPGKTEELKLVNLGNGFILMQTLTLSEDDRGPFPFLLMAGVAERDVVAIIPLPRGDQIVPFAARHPGVVLSPYKPKPFMTVVAPEGAEPPPPDPDSYYISAGSPLEIRDFVRDLVDGISKSGTYQTDDSQGWQGQGLLIRDQPSRPDHAPSATQQRDIDAMIGKLRVLLSPAP